MKAWVNTCCVRKDGTKDCFLTREVDVMVDPLRWHKQGLSFTASGYGARIPTHYKIKVDGRWRRVYCCIYSNSGTLFIGKKYDGTNTVTIWD